MYIRNKLEYNIDCIITILYSIVCMTCDKGVIDTLAFSLGADIKNVMMLKIPMHMNKRGIWIRLHKI